MTRTAVLLLAMLTALPVAAQIYSWKDKDGKTHYSDIPPPSGPVKTIRGTPVPAPVAPPAEEQEEGKAAGEQPAADDDKPKTLAEREEAFRKRRAAEAEAQAKAQQEQEREAERQRFCEDARNQLAALNSGQRMARMNAAGEREFISDEARSADISRLQRQIDENCAN